MHTVVIVPLPVKEVLCVCSVMTTAKTSKVVVDSEQVVYVALATLFLADLLG